MLSVRAAISVLLATSVSACAGEAPRPNGDSATMVRADSGVPSNDADTTCIGYRACIAAAEPRALSSRTDVRRDSLSLVFTLSGREPVILENGDPEQVDSHYYLYNGWDSKLAAHRVYLMEYESSAVLYVFPTSGAIVGLDEQPVLSPDGRYLATANLDTEAQMEANRARVFRILPDSLLLEWEIEPELWGPDSLRWLDNTTLVIGRVPAHRHPNPAAIRTPLTLRRVRGAWLADSGARAP